MKITKVYLAVSLILLITTNSHAINLSVISDIESSGNPNAYNKRSQATGLYQITPICLEDYNQFNSNRYTMNDMFNPTKAYTVAYWYITRRIPQLLLHFNHEVTVDNILTSYNCGVGCVGKKLPTETINYIRKYKERV